MQRLEAAQSYLKRGWVPVPIQPGKKFPLRTGWQKLRLCSEEGSLLDEHLGQVVTLEKVFHGPGGVGMLCGEPSGGLAGVDLDCAEAIRAAVILPITGLVRSRYGAERNMRFFHVVDSENLSQSLAFDDPARAKGEPGHRLVELLWSGKQVAVPPTIHPPTNKPYTWDQEGKPSQVKAEDLLRYVRTIGAGALLIRYWPGQGKRQDFALALGGVLVRAGWKERQAVAFVETMARAAGDEEAEIRARAVADTYGSFARQDKTTGGTSLRNLIAPEVASKIIEWLGGVERQPESRNPFQEAHPVLVRLSEVQAESVQWLWEGRIPFGKLTLLEGDPGLGKTTLALDIAARLTRGSTMPGSPVAHEPMNILLISVEDGIADTLKPRLEAAEGDLKRVLAMEEIKHVRQDGAIESRTFTIPDDLPFLEKTIQDNSFGLVIIDPLMAVLSGDVNSYRDQDVRRALAPLSAIAGRTGAAILVLRHLSKSAGASATYRGGGSIGIIGAARSALLVGRDPDQEDRRILASVKSNLGPRPASLSFQLTTVGEGLPAFCEWLGESSLSAEAVHASQVNLEDRSALDEAKDFLKQVLSEGAVTASAVKKEAQEAGIAEATLRRAKKALSIKPVKEKMVGPWIWALPEGAQEKPKKVIPIDEHLRQDVSTFEDFTL